MYGKTIFVTNYERRCKERGMGDNDKRSVEERLQFLDSLPVPGGEEYEELKDIAWWVSENVGSAALYIQWLEAQLHE